MNAPLQEKISTESIHAVYLSVLETRQPTPQEYTARRYYELLTKTHSLIGGIAVMNHMQGALRMHETAAANIQRGALLGPHIIKEAVLPGIGIYAPRKGLQETMQPKRRLQAWFSHDIPHPEHITAYYFTDQLDPATQKRAIYAPRLHSSLGKCIDYYDIDTKPTPYTSAWDAQRWQAGRCGNRWMFRYTDPTTQEERYYYEYDYEAEPSIA